MAYKVEVETGPETGLWNDYTSLVLNETLSVVSVGGQDAGTMSARLRDAAGTAVVLPECATRVTDGATVIFRGKVKKRGKVEERLRTREKWYAITCQDATSLLVDDIIDTGGVRSTAESDAARIVWLVSTFGSKGVTAALVAGGGFIQSLYGSNLPEQDFTGLSLYAAIGEVLKFSGGNIYVDTALALHHFSTETNAAPFNLSDNPNGSTTFGYQGFDFPDDSMDLTNAVYVIGADGVGEWVTDATSINTYGRKESAFKDAELADHTARLAAGNAILAQFKNPRGPIKVTVFRAGLRAGMTIQITNSVWGLTAVTYRIEQVEAYIQQGTSTFAYKVSLQDAPVTLQGQFQKAINTINQDVRRSTNIAVTYASQFLVGRIKVVDILPTLPDANYPEGMEVLLTSDDHLWQVRDVDGTLTWVEVVRAVDLTGQINSTQIHDDAISTPQILAGSVTAEEIAAGAITGDLIAANAIEAGHIAAGAIGAEALAAEIVLADILLTTGLSGQRMEMDDNGLRAYSAAEDLLVNIPTVGADPVTVRGEIEASSLVATGNAELRGEITVAAGAVGTLETGVSNPSAAPTLSASVPYLNLTSTPPYRGAGICYDPAGGAGGTTASYWLGADPTVGNLLDLAYEYNATTGALLRTLRKTGTTTTTTATLGATSHISDSAQADAFTGTQVATPLTMPRDGTITKVSFYATGYNGGTPTVRGAVWSSGNTKLGETVAQTLPDEGALGLGKSNHYDLAMTAGLAVTGGTTYRVGWYRTTSEGFQWDRDDGSGKTQYKGDGGSGNLTGISTDSARKPNVYITYTYQVDSSVEGDVGQIVGVARQGSYVWVLDNKGWLYRYNQSTLAFVSKHDLSGRINPDANAGLFFDGTYLVLTTVTGTTGTDQVQFVRVNTSGAWVSDHPTTGLTVNGASTIVRGGFGDATYYHVALSGSTVTGCRAYAVSTMAYVANTDWGLTSEMSSGITNGASGYGVGWSNSNPTKLYKYTAWVWTTESAVYWLCYTWYDITGTTHETGVSPRASVTMGRRRQLSVTTPAIPGGAAEPPDRVRVYMARGASDPGGANYDLQSTDAVLTRTFTTYNSAGAANPTSNNFPAGTAAVIQSATTGWGLRGNGYVSLGGGTSFPSGAVSGDTFYRTDLDLLFRYNGTRWLCACLHEVSFPGEIANLAATTSDTARASPPMGLGSDVWLEELDMGYNVVSGTLSGSNYWSLALRKVPTGGGASSVVVTKTINSGSTNVWRRDAPQNIDALLESGTQQAFLLWDVTKAGTIGNLYAYPRVTYRNVAT